MAETSFQLDHPSGATFNPRQQRAARWIWILSLFTVLLALGLAFPARLSQLLGDPYGLGPWLAELGLTLREFSIYGTLMDALVALGYLIIAGLTYWRKPGDKMVFLVSLALLFFPFTILPVTTVLFTAHPVLHAGVLTLRGLGFFLLGLALYRFQDGRFVPRWSRWLVVIWAIYFLLWFFRPELVPPTAYTEISSLGDILQMMAVVIFYGSAVVFQVYRYRAVSGPIQRQQTKWIVFGLTFGLVLLFMIMAPLLVLPQVRSEGLLNAAFVLVAIPVTLFSFLLLPVSLSIAILRYRLWDIDILIRRSLVYSTLTASLGIVYFTLVILLQQVLPADTPITIVLSTLAIAALFNPLRIRIQRMIDRRFYRRNFDAQLTMLEFSNVLREEVDIDRLSSALIDVVEETMYPSETSLWLRE